VNLVNLLHDDLKAQTVAYRPDGIHLAVGGIGETVVVWDTVAGQVVHRLLISSDGRQARNYAIAYSPDGTRIATGACGVPIVSLSR
jgi:WD40 repeat protein